MPKYVTLYPHTAKPGMSSEQNSCSLKRCSRLWIIKYSACIGSVGS